MSILYSLRWKVVGAIFLTSLLVLGGTALFIQQQTTGELARLRTNEQQDEFTDFVLAYYALGNTWDGVDSYLRTNRPPSLQNSAVLPPPLPGQARQTGQGGQQGQGGQSSQSAPAPRFLLISLEGKALSSYKPYSVGDKVPKDLVERAVPVGYNGVNVAYVADMVQVTEVDDRDQEFLARSTQALLLATAGAAGLALLVGVLFAQWLTGPLRALTAAMSDVHHLPAEPLKVRSRDEIGQLVRAFNQMKDDLATANHLRKQMTADIAHELRSPLTVIKGYIEALRDGTLKPSTPRFETIFTETQQLDRLIDDLRTLSLADAGELALELQALAPYELLGDVQRRFEHSAQQRGITLRLDAPHNLPNIRVDRARMGQVLGNLVGNALRYTPEGGEIRLKAARDGQHVVLTIEDTGSGIPEDKLPHIFRRFYRVDSSRQSETGNTGLGLAIVKSLVEAHGGSIYARSTVGVGTQMVVRLGV